MTELATTGSDMRSDIAATRQNALSQATGFLKSDYASTCDDGNPTWEQSPDCRVDESNTLQLWVRTGAAFLRRQSFFIHRSSAYRRSRPRAWHKLRDQRAINSRVNVAAADHAADSLRLKPLLLYKDGRNG
jgi:hypothetical protein